jgi:hypothetical protein
MEWKSLQLLNKKAVSGKMDELVSEGVSEARSEHRQALCAY